MRVWILILAVMAVGPARTEVTEAGPFSALRWRLIGPFRGGRVTAVAGVAGDPNTYYFGTPGGGIWKSTDAGRVWKPIFDEERIASIGALAVAPSDRRIIYAGTGEQTPGQGMFKSVDGGASWASAGLGNTRYIQAIIVDPKDPNVLVVGANSLGFSILWKPLPKSAMSIERGIYKSTDGGRSWQKMLMRDETIGVVDLEVDPNDPRRMYAVLFRPASGTGKSAVAATSVFVKSTDKGSTWQDLNCSGLPDKGRGRAGIAVAAGDGGRRLYAIMNQGLFRSDDGGTSWKQSTTDPRIIGSEYFSRIFPDPRNPDLLYVAQTSLYRSTDGGKTFEALAGAPSGDDFHVLWVDPHNSARMLLGVDQGAVISVDGGHTWTTWYNQPTGQFYHVSTDNVFPYRVYAAQQDSGTAAVLSRSDYGEITYRDWSPVGGFEYGFIAADPVNPNLVYSSGWFGTVVKFERTTGQVATVFERGTKYRTAQMAPLLFSPHDPHTLYLGTQFVLKTTNEGVGWTAISPDLTAYVEKEKSAEEREDSGPPPPAITALAPSPLEERIIWAGTSNRLIQLTRDGGTTWTQAGPQGLEDPEQVLWVEASHFDRNAAYVVVGSTRHSNAPYIARTRDCGKTWTTIVNGLPKTEKARVVREDPVRSGLLYAGTDTGVFVSFDDGDHWRSLQLNLPPSPVTDLTVPGDDLAVSTFGRSLWILDDIAPLRQWAPEIANAAVHLFRPAPAVRTHWDNYQDTPLPRETPAGKNPPDGAIIDYYLKSATSGPVTVRILDSSGRQVRAYVSDAKEPRLPPANVPESWFAPVASPPNTPAMNRFVWDLRYAPPATLPYGYYGELLEYTEYTLADHAIPENTPRIQPQGPLVLPGEYTVELSAGGITLRQPLKVTLDPRLRISELDLHEQFELEQRIIRGLQVSHASYREVAELRKAVVERGATVSGLMEKIDAVQKGTRKAPGFGPVNRNLARLLTAIEMADARPPETTRVAADEACKSLSEDLVKWRELNDREIPAANAALHSHRLPALPEPGTKALSACSE